MARGQKSTSRSTEEKEAAEEVLVAEMEVEVELKSNVHKLTYVFLGGGPSIAHVRSTNEGAIV